MNRTLHRPEPYQGPAPKSVVRSTPALQAAARLRDGELLMVTDHYNTGVEILAQLRSLLDRPGPDASYVLRQASSLAWRETSLRLLAPIKDHRLALTDAGVIGFLRELYPRKPRFVLPFVQAQELYGSWNRYLDGVHLTVLGHRVHPFYGTYVPVRTSHLELFGTWLSQYTGPRSQAIDVGTGCGVLALMLCKAGFQRVRATDHNPNAIESVTRELRRLSSSPPIELVQTDLLGKDPTPADLVVFNPPWTQGSVDGLLDQALVFQPGLFERFFEQAHARITPSGRVVVVFSNLIQLVQPDVAHPILAELERGRLRLVQKLHRKVKPVLSSTGSRRRTREKVEVWELAKA